MPLSPGARVDRYEVLELLGSGGMGEVYRARDPKLERHVALKVLHVDPGMGTDGGARLLREARAAAALSHPNVLSVYDVGEVEEPEALRGTAYIAMELVVGMSLREYVGDETVPMERRIGWLKDIARALAAAHEAGLVHRDVKPENVMIRFDGVVKVLDFGIARRAVARDARSTYGGHSLPTMKSDAGGALAAGTTAGGRAAGTPYYMAPEQLRGERLDGRADQFAWAVTAYELLTGAGPWGRGKDALSVGLEILSSQPRPASEGHDEVPGLLSDVIAKAMAKAPEERFPSMVAVLAELEGAAPPVSTLRSVAPSVRSGPGSEKVGDAARAGTNPTGRPRRVGRTVAAVAGAVAVLAVVTSWSVRRYANREIRAADSGAVAASAGEACTSSAACSKAHGGAAWRCNQKRHTCVEMTTPDCKVYAESGDLQSDDAIWFGGMFPIKTDFIVEMRAAELARQDFAHTIGRGTAPSGQLHARPIGLVVCDEGKDPTRPARHLVDDVEVPAVLGLSSAEVVYKTVPTLFLPAKVLSMVSIAQTVGLTSLPEPADEPRLIWRSTLDAADLSGPWSALVSDVLEPRARSGPNGLGTRSFRVAILEERETVGEITAQFFRALRFNGKSALENGDDFRDYTIEPRDDASIAAAVQSIVRFRPQVVFAFCDPSLLERLEGAWRGEGRPSYVVGSDFDHKLLAFIGRSAERRRRFFSVTNVSTTVPNAELVLRYNQAFPDERILRTNAPQPSYDGFYLLAYAALALGDAPVTGPALSGALRRLLPPGLPVDIGPVGIPTAFEALRAGRPVDLNGALGSLDFDPATGEAPADYAILCCGVDDAGNASGAIESGLVYDDRQRTLTGTLRCP